MRAARENRRRRIAAAAAIALLALALSGCAAQTQQPAATSSATSARTAGVVEYGSGAKTVDLYVDPLCPYCRHFEQLSGPMLLSEAKAGRLTLRVHPMAILDRLSNGTRYSTRAAAAVLTVAASHPHSWPAFLAKLFENQPEENSAGLTDEQLQALATDAGTPVTLTSGTAPMEAEVASATQNALQQGVSHVPTVMVNGKVFPGSSQETAKFETFYRNS
ncbi:hypothetical protein ATY41_09460 [Leifsonia xyli subsp. xyli]|uniref:Thioredoxin-like fold domain-containing protein n=2 Tax=Leifsonia xyli subsp. xyli TaxID=59736 RepID=Q6ACU1_LEIXX|nr:thioredoxin domain-containing protein [Leifsonia xyli]AAT89802.1 conserved hypothetical protein [Leifsonia xyli subsp. xyli str. CTCB07]ODA90640.1 hypothetical protein ATY41_09460 [Leifsonia xyli subsp. xyli]